MAMILVTHDLGVVAGRTDEIAVMYAGTVVEKAPTAVLFAADAHALHRGAALRRSRSSTSPQPHPARGHRRPAAGPRQPAARAASSPPLPPTRRTGADEEPPLRSSDTTRATSSRCWYPVGTPGGRRRRSSAQHRRRVPAGAAHAHPAPAPRRPRSCQLMAGSGTAHLRPADDVLLRVENLVVEFPVGPQAARSPRSPSISFDVLGRDPRPRRRVRLRQVDHRPGHHAAAPPDPAGRCTSTARSSTALAGEDAAAAPPAACR